MLGEPPLRERQSLLGREPREAVTPGANHRLVPQEPMAKDAERACATSVLWDACGEELT
jgi:hypothetical protein